MVWRNRVILEQLGITHPVCLAPMAGATNAAMVIRFCEAGGLGGLGAAGLRPERLRDEVRAIKAGTNKPFQVNVFAATTEPAPASAVGAPGTVLGPGLRALLEGYHEELGLAELPAPVALFGPVAEQLAVLLEERVPVISFHFGVDPDTVAILQNQGIQVLCSATTVAEARQLAAAGVDAIIAQGAEAGGHRGTFLGDYRDGLIGTMALVPQIVDAVTVPVIAAGGIMDGRGLVAALALGASAVQMGTAFLGCHEAPIADAWRRQLFATEADQVTVTSVLSGKPARGIRNRLIREVEALDEALLPYPLQYSLSRELRQKAQQMDNADFLAMWAGQGLGLLRDTSISALLQSLVDDAQALIARL